MHCYRADEMATILDMSREFGYHVRPSIMPSRLQDRRSAAEHGVCAAMWRTGGLQDGIYDGIPENIAFVDAAPTVAPSCTPTPRKVSSGSTRKLRSHCIRPAGRTADSPERAIKWLTANPAKSMGVLERLERWSPARWATCRLERQPLQCLRARRVGLHRWRPALRRPIPHSRHNRTSRWVSRPPRECTHENACHGLRPTFSGGSRKARPPKISRAARRNRIMRSAVALVSALLPWPRCRRPGRRVDPERDRPYGQRAVCWSTPIC